MGARCRHREMIHCQVCGTTSYGRGTYTECPTCAERAGRKALNLDCPHHDDKPDPYCWTRQTNHCSCCKRTMMPWEVMYQYMPIASKENGWGPVWCAACGPQNHLSDWERFNVDPAVPNVKEAV